MIRWARRHWRWTVPSAVALVALGLWLFFGFFAFHTIWIDDTVDEPLPFFSAGPAPSGIDGDETTADEASAMNEAMADLSMPMIDEVDEPMPPQMAGAEMPATAPSAAGQSATGDAGSSSGSPSTVSRSQSQQSGGADADDGSASADATQAAPDQDGPEPDSGDSQPGAADADTADSDAADQQEPVAPDQPEAPAEPEEPRIIIEASGSFVSRSHPTQGSALVLGDGSGLRFLRFEDFRTDNGPDLNVYLSAASPGAPAGEFDDDFVDLGDLKGNVGAQNFEIPAGVDLDHYSTVAVWCVRFSVVFGVADLAAA